MKRTTPVRIQSISEFHRFRGLPPPEHPLISVVDYAQMKQTEEGNPSLLFDFYSISIKRGITGKLYYGQQQYDFDEGLMFFMSPGQVLRIAPDGREESKRSGWLLLIHPDFLWHTVLARTIRKYEFFDYSVHEALFLSEKEEAQINGIIDSIRQEYHANIDRFSQRIILSLIETLLNYSERFYQRQFITRKISNHQVLERMEVLLNGYFDNETVAVNGLPTVQWLAEQLAISPSYLSGLLKTLTGQSTQQHIQDKVIDKAKEKLSTTDLTVSEIAYELGFEHSQSFSKLFKARTNLSPLEFRQSFG